ncbi:MAG TPA: ATP-binding protein [Planctomycetaceae bacterium]|nr:ATP-binding protein [Planctomycetaceae bacterium]
MAEAAESWTLSDSIPSDLDQGHHAIEKLLDAMRERNWEGRDYFHVQMAAEEAMVNAVEHGNKKAADKHVDIAFVVTEDEVYMQFTDEGEGFDPEDLPDPRDDENLHCTNGRGVMLIKEMMSEVKYSERGNQVEMWKRRSASSEESEAE